MTEGEVRYCTTSDGVRIAYSIEGDGPPLLVCPFFVESFSLIERIPPPAAFWQRFRQRVRVIRFDPRGIGLSERNIDTIDAGKLCLDMEAVVKASGVPRVALWVSQAAGPYGLRFAATRKRVVSRLIVVGTYERPTQIFTEDATRAYGALWKDNPEIAARTLADLSNRDTDPGIGQAFARVYMESVSSKMASMIFEASLAPDWDAGPFLGKITVPTLVMHRRGDNVYPYAIGQAIAAAIKGARFLPLEGDFADYHLGDSESIIRAAISFLEEDTVREKPAPDHELASTFRTILFTDLVGHTEMMRRLGDERGRAVLREHERITRDLLKQHGGAEVKTMGDGFMASFGSVMKAMDCAIALQRAFNDASNIEHLTSSLQVRCGLNAGEPIEEDGDLFGSTVIMASRIAAKAGAGEILIPEPLRHLLTGKSYVYADRGETMLKGFEDAVRLYEVRWRE
jgi:class 3 adenylate cyclase/pimeloyl-ACP methyl ester carboxylesterase